ncbi:MAG TPA: SRPBCC family protein [Chloroflexia bacterium]|nr:SRPBCC family protein [Chloroflexia bacterium]
MTRIYTTIAIRRPPAAVFEYVTTPGNWPQWHVSSLGVQGATDHSLAPGEQVTEAFRVAGRRGRVVWTVRERDASRRWVIARRIIGGGGGVITYTLRPTATGTRFEREFVYEVPTLLMALLDRLVVRRRVTRESTASVRRLKQVLERDAS